MSKPFRSERPVAPSNDRQRHSPILEAVLGRRDRPAAGKALEMAERMVEILGRSEFPRRPHVGVTRDGSVVLTFEQDRRVASYEFDSDGDVVFTLVDNDSTRDPQAEVLELSAIRQSLSRASAFLG